MTGEPIQMPADAITALNIERLCKRYPAYTPDTARRASVRTLRHVALIDALSGQEA